MTGNSATDMPVAKTNGALGKIEEHRRFAVSIVLLIYFLALVEGPLRKWILPDFSTPIYFLRDPIVLYLYFFCFRHRFIAFKGLGGIWVGFAAVAVLVGGIGFITEGHSPAGWLLGIRSYWLYMPMAFVIAALFRRGDIARFLRLNVLLAIPYAALVASQYSAPANAWVNLGIAGDDTAAVGLGSSIIRPFGLFTFTGQNAAFTASMTAMFLALIMMPRSDRLPAIWMLVGGIAIATMAVLTGSRSIYFFLAAIVFVTLLGLNFARPGYRTVRLSLATLALVVAGAALLAYAFPDMYAAMEARFVRAAASEGPIWDRATSIFVGAIDAFDTAPLFGHGIGAGAPAIARALGLQQLVFGEGDLQRHVMELGVVVGVILIFLRLATAGYLVVGATRAARKGRLAALPLSGYTLIPIGVGQITNSTLNGFQPWIMVGLALALIHAKPESLRDSEDRRR